MVKVSIEVKSGTACFGVAVQAESIRRAVDIVAGRYPGRDVRVKFPIDPVDFFIEDSHNSSSDSRVSAAKKMAA